MRSDEEKHIKRIQISQEASYLCCLEKEYLEIYKWINPDLTEFEAQAALEKIRHEATR